MKNYKPAWYKQAKEQGIDYIVIVYEKAEGFIFCPSNLEYPFRVGGDYNGNYPTCAQGALTHYTHYLNKAFTDRLSWFLPFVEKVANDEDFSLDDLELYNHSVRVIKGKWPW